MADTIEALNIRVIDRIDGRPVPLHWLYLLICLLSLENVLEFVIGRVCLYNYSNLIV